MCNVGFFLCFCFPVCDPVMGDDGKFYVTPELVPVYREKVLVYLSVLFLSKQGVGVNLQRGIQCFGLLPYHLVLLE